MKIEAIDAINAKYNVIEVEKTSPPQGMEGDNWFRYVIKKGNSVMDCKKSGTLKSVTSHAKDLAELINSRNVSGRRK
jgi:hypothetical protein